MELLLQRLEHNETLTTSALFVGRKLYALVPEDPPREVKIKGQTRIPAGRYRLALEHSPKFSPTYGHSLLTLLDVPDFTGIRIHRGNTPSDTAGCILPNAQVLLNPAHGHKFYLSSAAYEHVYREVGTFLANGGEAWITVQDEGVLFPNWEPESVA